MLKVSSRCATVALGLASVLAFAASSFAQGESSSAQSGAASAPQKKVLKVESIRPFTRSETPANQAPNLYDPKSDEFNYFREDLGRSELSSKTRARLAEQAARVVYVDPMDKPAADGTPFVNIYDPDEVFVDGKPFVGQDDPDVFYKSYEDNFLAKFARGCKGVASLVSVRLGGSASNAQGGAGTYGSQFGGSSTPYSMPTPSMDPSVAPGGMPGSMGSMPGSMGDPKDGKSASSPAVEPSANDDSKLLFPGDEVKNPFKEPVAIGEGDFDFFKADREFAPKAPAPQTNGGYMMDGYMGSGPH